MAADATMGEAVLTEVRKHFPKTEWKKVGAADKGKIERLTREIGQLVARQMKGERVGGKIKLRQAALRNYAVAAGIDAARLADRGWDSLVSTAVRTVVEGALKVVLKALA